MGKVFFFIYQLFAGWINLCHAEYIKMTRPFLIVSQSDYLIQIVDTNSHTK